MHIFSLQSSFKIFDYFLFATISTLIITGLFSYEQLTAIYFQHNLLPTNAIFDTLIVAFTIITISRHISLICLPPLICSLSYITSSWLNLNLNHSSEFTAVDFIISYKPYIYTILLCLCKPRENTIGEDIATHLFKLITICFLMKYIVAKYIYDINRPGIFTENNFELVLLTVLFTYLHRVGQLKSYVWPLLLFALVLISGSRSGFLSLIIAYMTSSPHFRFRFWMSVLVIPIFLIFTVLLFDTRLDTLSNIDKIDRYVFMRFFTYELRDFSIWQYIVGWPPMTPLSVDTCSKLSFYKSLFSNGNEDICYSVILHIFYLRTILDHGILGLLFLILGFFIALKNCGLNSSLSLALLMQGLINGLSVSGLGNTYYIFGIFLVISAHHSRHKETGYE